MDEASSLARNIHIGSGKHGISESDLYQIFKDIQNIELFAYTLKKCAEHGGQTFFSTQEQTVEKPNYANFTKWHHIDEPWDYSWNFSKRNPGCYIYGLFEAPPENDKADFLSKEVFYIGESRAITRNSMLGRRADFKNGVRNEWVSPMGNSQTFREVFGQNQINKVYQAYLPMHSSFCKESELYLLSQYYLKYNKIPVCNPELDYQKVKKYLKNNP